MIENNLTGEPAELRMTIEVIRAGTGIKETYELIGTPMAEEKTETVDDNGIIIF